MERLPARSVFLTFVSVEVLCVWAQWLRNATERERERESVCECVSEWVSVRVWESERERESVCVCVCVWVCECESERVWESEWVSVRVRVRECEREWVRVSEWVSGWVGGRDKGHVVSKRYRVTILWLCSAACDCNKVTSSLRTLGYSTWLHHDQRCRHLCVHKTSLLNG
jgi:hypothetical protein